jgi:hypothetical protein
MTTLVARAPRASGPAESWYPIDLSPRPDTLNPADHRQVVARVARMYQAAKRVQSEFPPAYQPRGEWESYLAEREEFHRSLLSGDLAVAEQKLREFWRNELGAIVKEYARFEQLGGR